MVTALMLMTMMVTVMLAFLKARLQFTFLGQARPSCTHYDCLGGYDTKQNKVTNQPNAGKAIMCHCGCKEAEQCRQMGHKFSEN